jgi:thiol-disulfide isomerase/thioredoxin
MIEGAAAPELDAGLGWLNSDRPLRIGHELRGHVVVLDFWTYCCINCIHILPDLAYLEEKYAVEPVMFLGVHSAKFPNEAHRETIRAAILRYEIAHPVVIDDRMSIWRGYKVRSWPTVVVVDSAGRVIRVAAGEGNREAIDAAISQGLRQGRAAGTLASGPLKLRRESCVRAASGLAFPGKVLADAHAERLYVADSNHNRIVIAELPDERGVARVVQVVGDGRIGREDGPPQRARFHHPQGLAAARGKLYVADTENHLIRAIDLSSFVVTTVAGTGMMDNDRAGGGMGTDQGINSPWDLAVEGSTLYVAMAGVHQIWRIDLPVGFARALAGSGRENLVDGPAETAALAQPSGICLLGDKIYFADSEVSAVRGIDLAREVVFTVLGEGLFSFGDADGAFPHARLQHPLGVAAHQGGLLVADTYNHKIKRVDPGGRSSMTLYGTGRPAASAPDGGPAFFEPGGLAVAGEELYVADTNNHRVVRIHLPSGRWGEIAFQSLSAPPTADDPDSPVLDAEPVGLAPGRDIELVLEPRLPHAARFSPEAPWSVRVEAGGRILLQSSGRSNDLPIIVSVPAGQIGPDDSWTVTAALAYCRTDGQELCIPVRLTWRVPLRRDGSASRIRLTAQIPPLATE